MADFCVECAKEMWGSKIPSDFVGMTKEEDTLNDRYITVLCEGCGMVQVDHEGRCVTDCLRHHKPQQQPNT